MGGVPWDPPVYLTSGLERAAGAEKFFDHCLQGIFPEKMVHFGKKVGELGERG